MWLKSYKPIAGRKQKTENLAVKKVSSMNTESNTCANNKHKNKGNHSAMPHLKGFVTLMLVSPNRRVYR